MNLDVLFFLTNFEVESMKISECRRHLGQHLVVVQDLCLFVRSNDAILCMSETYGSMHSYWVTCIVRQFFNYMW
jgi:hypothetical protein